MDGIALGDARTPDGMRIYAVGDIHGRLDCLKAMYTLIEQDLAASPVRDWRIVHLGDYIDRGPDSRGVVEFLLDRLSRNARVITLVGNHDLEFLNFLADPERRALFARFGGVDTARSYGVDLSFRTEAMARAGHRALTRTVPSSHIAFFGSLHPFYEAGDYFFCHAGIRPGVALALQTSDDLAWIRQEFLQDERLHPKVIVHGHTPAEEAEIRPNRINVDTRAYDTGRLTAAVLEGNRFWLIEAKA